MPVMVLKDAAKLSDVITKLTADVPAAGKEAIAAAIRAANPQLGRRQNLAAGTIVMLPSNIKDRLDISGVVSKRPRDSAVDLTDSIEAFAAHLKDALAAESDQVSEMTAAAKSAEVRDLVKAAQLDDRLKGVNTALKARAKNIATVKAFIEKSLVEAAQDLKDLSG